MTNAYTLRNHFTLGNYNTTITRTEFERSFTKTKESVTFTFMGWDGKSYDGESRTSRVYRTSYPGFEEIRFIKVGKHLHNIDEDDFRIEKATGESHPTASWVIDVRKAQ